MLELRIATCDLRLANGELRTGKLDKSSDMNDDYGRKEELDDKLEASFWYLLDICVLFSASSWLAPVWNLGTAAPSCKI